MTIIQTIEYNPYTLAQTILMCVGLTGTIISFLTLSIIPLPMPEWKVAIMAFCIAVFGIAFIAGGLLCVSEPELRYQILINDNTPISEVQKKYEIVEQQGISYIVVEKEVN